MVTAQKKQELDHGTLRRGFLGSLDETLRNSPIEFRKVISQRIEKLKEQRRYFYEKLGRPNKKNFTMKYKGAEHKLGRDQYDAKAYFEMGEEIKNLSLQNLAVKQWLAENEIESDPLVLLKKAIYEVVPQYLAAEIYQNFDKKINTQFDQLAWEKFLDKLLEGES